MSSDYSGSLATMAAVKPTTLPRSLLRFPPSSSPTTLPPPSDHPTLAHPFTIRTDIYNTLLSPSVPITVALVYVSVVSYLNSVNAKRDYKPWAFSRTSTFKALVILHNIILTVYSGWTCLGMINALTLSLADWKADTGLAGVVDSVCKIHGPRGLGSAATFNETSHTWALTNRAFHLAADGLGPESTDVGRIWNEGLAFYGWLFYLSKFYEVIDTAIILAKGKKSSFLQAYHHAGAMLCMWAGIRYMAPPIWMFVLVNSGIHTIMYTFYLCTAIGIRIPKKVKQTLTTMQITQFVVGATYAFAHLFVAYKIPVSVPYLYHLGTAVSSAALGARSDAQSVASSVVATASAGILPWLKKAALRAAGREGLAENILNDEGQTFGVDATHMVEDFVSRKETRFRDELQWTHCLDTSGQVFAILLNCMYLAPLTWLFVRFFITAYRKRLERRRSSTASEAALVARQSFQDAYKGFARQVSEAVDEMHGGIDEISQTATPLDVGELKKEVSAVQAAALEKLSEGVERVKKLKEELGGSIDPIEYLRNQSAEKLQRKPQTPSESKEISNNGSSHSVGEEASDGGLGKSTQESGEKAMEATRPGAEDATENVKENADKVGENVAEKQHSVEEKSAAEMKPAEEHEQTKTGTSKSDTDVSEEHQEQEQIGVDDDVNKKSPIEATEDQNADSLPSPNDDGTGVEEATGTSTALAEETSSEDQSGKRQEENEETRAAGLKSLSATEVEQAQDQARDDEQDGDYEHVEKPEIIPEEESVSKQENGALDASHAEEEGQTTEQKPEADLKQYSKDETVQQEEDDATGVDKPSAAAIEDKAQAQTTSESRTETEEPSEEAAKTEATATTEDLPKGDLQDNSTSKDDQKAEEDVKAHQEPVFEQKRGLQAEHDVEYSVKDEDLDGKQSEPQSQVPVEDSSDIEDEKTVKETPQDAAAEKAGAEEDFTGSKDDDEDNEGKDEKEAEELSFIDLAVKSSDDPSQAPENPSQGSEKPKEETKKDAEEMSFIEPPKEPVDEPEKSNEPIEDVDEESKDALEDTGKLFNDMEKKADTSAKDVPEEKLGQQTETKSVLAPKANQETKSATDQTDQAVTHPSKDSQGEDHFTKESESAKPTDDEDKEVDNKSKVNGHSEHDPESRNAETEQPSKDSSSVKSKPNNDDPNSKSHDNDNKSNYREESEDKENQDPNKTEKTDSANQPEEEEGDDDTAPAQQSDSKVREDTTFADAVKE